MQYFTICMYMFNFMYEWMNDCMDVQVYKLVLYVIIFINIY